MGKILIPGGGGGVDTSMVTASANDVLTGKVIVDKDGNPLTGTMPENEVISQTLNCGESVEIPEGYHPKGGQVVAASLSSQTQGTATSADVLSGRTAVVNGEVVTGTMTNNGAVAPSALGAGGSYTIPAGYHNGSGKVTVQSLATMTASGDATASQILSGKKAYVDGNLITGNIASKAAATYYATTSDQTIAAGQYLSGAQTIKALSQTNLAAGNILKGKTITINNGSANVWSVAGSLAVTSAISFSAAALSATSIRISWTNPSKGPWEGVFIQMSTSGYPGVSGGSRVYTGRGNSTTAGGSNYVDITGLSFSTTYYFTCTSYATGLGNGSSHNVSAKTSSLVLYSNGACQNGAWIEGNWFYFETSSGVLNGKNLRFMLETQLSAHRCTLYPRKNGDDVGTLIGNANTLTDYDSQPPYTVIPADTYITWQTSNFSIWNTSAGFRMIWRYDNGVTKATYKSIELV